MCGIAGFWQPREAGEEAELCARAETMARALAHRGPDDSGAWADARVGFALGHRRLAVIDVSPHGAQPMSSASDRYRISFNGEIYNYRELRRELEREARVDWRGSSDTEVMLAAFDQWGLEETLPRLQGMFAFALWDRREQVLHLARDRFGEKPLYYGWSGDILLFGSELKALTAHPAWCGRIDRVSLARFLQLAYVPAPRSIYEGIHKVMPGTCITITHDTVKAGIAPPSRAYWSLAEAAVTGTSAPLDDRDAVDRLEYLLREAIRRQMVADVPLGAFLSGGVDSSTVVALMQAQSILPVKTFSIGFREQGFDEAPFARAVAAHLGTDHHEHYVEPREALEVVPQLPSLYDEPFGDSSQIPTHLVSRLARKHVTVSLSGDGGDELFCGYDRYRWGRRIRLASTLVPAHARHALRRASSWLPQSPFAARAQKLARALDAGDEPGIYGEIISQWSDAHAMVKGAPDMPLWEHEGDPPLPDFGSRMMFWDTLTYLPDDLLVKIDRAAMGVSLETRVPLLDHRVVELAWRLPARMKCRGRTSKWALRQVLYRYVPRGLIERPKRGFAVPIHAWLRGPMREWAEALLAPERLEREGLLDTARVRQRWEEHVQGRANWQYGLWNVLMFQAWLEAWCER